MFLSRFLNKFCCMCVNIFTRVFTLKNIRKIFIVFLVGFSCRVGIHFFLGINVFMDYLNFVSFVYYGFMSCFTGFIFDLSKISFNVFNFKLIRNAIKEICREDLNKMFSSNLMFEDNVKVENIRDLPNDTLILKQEGRRSEGKVRVRRPSAGLVGLYGVGHDSSYKASAGLRGLYGDNIDVKKHHGHRNNKSDRIYEVDNNRRIVDDNGGKTKKHHGHRNNKSNRVYEVDNNRRIVGDNNGKAKKIKNGKVVRFVPELDSTNVYELDGRSVPVVHELDSTNVYELDGRPTINYSKSKTNFNPWCPESYNRINNVEDTTNKLNNLSLHSDGNESTQLGSKISSDRNISNINSRDYYRGFSDGVLRVYKMPKVSKREKVFGAII